MRPLARGALLVSIAIGASIACAPIEGTPLSQGPMNACPDFLCETYNAPKGTTGFSKAQCNAGRCETSVGMPAYATAVVVDVPDTSFYAPGRTFVLTRDEVNQASDTGSRRCRPPACVQLPVLYQGVGHYRVSQQAATDVGFPQPLPPQGAPIPYRVTFDRLFGSSNDNVAALGLPIDLVYASARVVRTPASVDVTYSSAVAVGRYRRVATPEPPYDAYFPPIESTLPVADGFLDEITLGDTKSALDDPTGEFRLVTLKREDGLDGFHAWLADQATDRRISTVRPVTGASSVVRLDTVNQKQPNGTTPAIRDGVVVVLAPANGVLAVPTMRVPLILIGSNLGEWEYPTLPDAAAASGIVAVEGADPGSFVGVPSKLVFASTKIQRRNGDLVTYLGYETSVSTDGNGRFATVLPPGIYDVFIEPAEGTGRAKVAAQQLDIASARRDLVFRPTQLRTKVEGHVRLTDTLLRDVADAEVRAVPKPPASNRLPMPRPGRARTSSDGRFTMDLDPGQYDIVVDPQSGTGFPRVVTQTTVGGTPVKLETIEVPPPVRVSITFRDPNDQLAGNPIVRATVRVFAPRVTAQPGEPWVEIGRAMTDESGACEILLAQQPP